MVVALPWGLRIEVVHSDRLPIETGLLRVQGGEGGLPHTSFYSLALMTQSGHQVLSYTRQQLQYHD